MQSDGRPSIADGVGPTVFARVHVVGTRNIGAAIFIGRFSGETTIGVELNLVGSSNIVVLWGMSESESRHVWERIACHVADRIEKASSDWMRQKRNEMIITFVVEEENRMKPMPLSTFLFQSCKLSTLPGYKVIPRETDLCGFPLL